MAIRSKMLSIVLIIGVELRGSAAAVTTNDLLRNNISDLHFKLFTSIQKQNRMLKSAVFETECSGRGCTFSGCQSSQSSSCDGKMLSTLRQIEISVKQLTGKDRNKEELWLDLNDLSVEGRWWFFSTGKPVTYTNWMPRQPDSVGEDYAQMNYPGHKRGQWNECEHKLRFICETFDNLWNE